MWKKFLKYRDIAQTFTRVKVRNGENTSFWYDTWLPMGRLYDIMGQRGFIYMGISAYATVASVLRSHRNRQHRVGVLNGIEAEITKKRQRYNQLEEDVVLWKTAENKYSKNFFTKQTWKLIRNQPRREWYWGVWFSNATPKYAFFTWLAIHNRLTIGDRMLNWNFEQSSACGFCGQEETRTHLFFFCHFSMQIWQPLVLRLLSGDYSSGWKKLVKLLHTSNFGKLKIFLFRYVFQSALYHIWRKREIIVVMERGTLHGCSHW